jgi:hypothetical protein
MSVIQQFQPEFEDALIGCSCAGAAHSRVHMAPLRSDNHSSLPRGYLPKLLGSNDRRAPDTMEARVTTFRSLPFRWMHTPMPYHAHPLAVSAEFSYTPSSRRPLARWVCGGGLRFGTMESPRHLPAISPCPLGLEIFGWGRFGTQWNRHTTSASHPLLVG